MLQLGGWISVSLVPKFISGQIYLPNELSATRDAYLFFSISGFFFAIFFFLIYSFNIITIKPRIKLPIELLVCSEFHLTFIKKN